MISGALKTVLSTYKLVCSNSTNSIYSVFACYIKGHGMFGGFVLLDPLSPPAVVKYYELLHNCCIYAVV